MPSISEIAKRVTKLASDNSPAILTATAVTGVVTTAVLAAKASFEAADILAMEEELRPDEYLRMLEEDRLGRTKLVWQCYIPAGIAGISTIAACVASQHISSRRNAALLSVASLTENAFTQYKEKVLEQIGENKEQKVRDAVAEDRVRANPPKSTEVIITGQGDMLCHESMSGRYFKSNPNAIGKAVNEANQEILQNMYCSQNDFNNLLGLEPTTYGFEVGWNIDKMIEVQFTSMLTDDKEPVLVIGYNHMPFVHYDKIG